MRPSGQTLAANPREPYTWGLTCSAMFVCRQTATRLQLLPYFHQVNLDHPSSWVHAYSSYQFKLRVGPSKMPTYKISFAPRWSGFRQFVMSTHTPDPRLTSGTEHIASGSGNVYPLPTTPVMNCKKLTKGKDIEDSKQVQDAPILELGTFLKLHLSLRPKKYTNSRYRWKKNKVAEITNCINEREVELYKPICDLLNVISQHLFSTTFITVVLTMHSSVFIIIRVLPTAGDRYTIQSPSRLYRPPYNPTS